MNENNEETPGVSGNSSEGYDQVGGQLVSEHVTEEMGSNSNFDWKSMSILERADYFLELGWTVVPLHGVFPDGTCSCDSKGEDLKNAGKHPTKSDWQNSCEGASKPKVHSWLSSKSKPMNIGLYAKPSGFFVIDVDPRSDGHLSWIRMENASEGEIPRTVEAITGKYQVSNGHGGQIEERGAHYYFKAKPGDYFVGNLKKLGYPGIDIKHSGYVVAPGSTHHSGVDYEWKPGHAPWEIEMAEAPEGLLRLIKKKYSGSGTGYRKVSSLGDEEWIEKWDAMRKQTVSETRYAKAALSRICAEIARLDDDRNNELNRAAFRVGQLVAGEQLMFAPSREALIAAAKKSYGTEFASKEAKVESVLREYGGGFENGAMNPQLLHDVPTPVREVADSRSLEVGSPEATELEELLFNIQTKGILSEAGTLNTATAIAAIKLLGPITSGTDKRLWYYKDGYWKFGAEDEISRRWLELAGDRAKQEHVSTITKFIASEPAQIEGVGPEHLINFTNGMLNWRTLELVEHDPDYFSVFQLPYEWNPEAVCPTIESWLAEVVDNEIIPLLEEIVGVSLYSKLGPQKAPILSGSGRNGKGTFLRLIDAIIPEHVRAHVPLQDFDANQFAKADLFGKVINSCGDLPSTAMKNTSTFKQLTGEDTIRGEFKNKNSFKFKSSATMIFSANQLPTSSDTSKGYYSRLLIVPFGEKSLEDSDIDGTLEPRLHAELQGFVVKAIQGLQRVDLAGGRYSNPKQCDDALKDYKLMNDSVQSFVDKYVEPDPDSLIHRSRVMEMYRQYCFDLGTSAVPEHEFYKKMELVTSKYSKTKKSDGTRSFSGFKVTYPLAY